MSEKQREGREANAQTKRLMILQWALPVAMNPQDPILKL